MSGPGPQEHSYLKVLHDFQYKTAEGREIIIKKNERLYLLQKTNADWWQVVRNLEQRSFYVPATYVREISKTSASSTRKNSEEDRDNIFEPPQDPSYKSMPRESSNAMRNVKKWLAGAMDSKPEPPKTLYSSDIYQKNEIAEDGPRGHAISGPIDHKTKSLERDLRTGHSFSDREEDTSHESPRSRDGVEQPENSSASKINRLSTSPKSCGLQFRMEAALQDPFRRELESSLDRRNLGVKGAGKVGTRIRTRSTNSEGSHANSDGGEHREAFERTEREVFGKPDGRKLNLSVHEESRRDSESSSGTSRNSRSLDFEGSKFSIRRERSVSPKPLYGRQMTIGGGGAAIYQEKPATSGGEAAGDHKILNDKRRTWAVEELMSELTQMCKERVVNKKPVFQLKSTEIKGSFDPLEKLTREIHEMNRLRTETNIPGADDAATTNSNASPINVCKIAINTETTSVGRPKPAELQRESEPSVAANDQQEIQVEIRKRSPSVSQAEADQPRQLKSPKSPKILDEYNEANILNDSNSPESRTDAARSLSPDKQSPYRRRTSSVVAVAESCAEQPCYSNVKVSAERAKLRPKLRIKTMEPAAELRLTPSLEKLASEIQFLPARRTSQTDARSTGGEADPRGIEDGSKSDDSLERRARRGILKNRLEYSGSFKTQREKRDETKRGEAAGLKKSSTLHCATIPECYRRFRRNDAERFEPLIESAAFKRRSRSLGDLEVLEQNLETRERKDTGVSRISKCRPVPLPRTKIPAVKNREPAIDRRAQLAKENSEGSSPRTLPEQRRNSREKRSDSQDELNGRGVDYAPPPVHFLADHHPNHFGGGRNANIESSTAVGFKTLLCASDSGSDNCLQSKELLRSSTGNLNDRGSLRAARKSSSSANFNDRTRGTRESLSDEQILSSNASSEALHSHSESEVTATLDVSSQPSPVARSEHDGFECAAINLPPGWTQKYDADTGQICFLNQQGDKSPTAMDDEGCVMEEKSLFGRLYAARGAAEENDGLSDTETKSAWLPDGLRRRMMSRSFENVRETRIYPVMDWLREIRLSCDLYDVGLPAKDHRRRPDSASNEDRWSSEEDVENIALDEPICGFRGANSPVDDYETHLRAIDELAAMLEAEEERDELTQSRCDDSCGNDESSAGKEPVADVAFIPSRGDALTTPIDARNSSNTCGLGTERERNGRNDFKDFARLSGMFFRDDDDRALEFCERFLREENAFFDRDSRRIGAGGSQQEAESLKRHKATNVDFGCAQCADLEVVKIDTSIPTILVNDSSIFPGETQLDEFESAVNPAQRFDDFEVDLSDENVSHCDSWTSSQSSRSESRNSGHHKTTNVDFECPQCAASDVNSVGIDETLLPIILANDLAVLTAKAMRVDEGFNDEFASKLKPEVSDDSDATDDVESDREERLCDYSNRREDNKRSDHKTQEFTSLNRNLDGDCKASTMPVMHWIGAFNDLNTMKETARSTDRTRVDAFNILNENNSEACELCHERSRGWRGDAGDKSLGNVGKFLGIDIFEDYRRRKGSASSDVVAWKRNLRHECSDEEESGDQWFSSNDAEGKIYFFEENSNESSWVLPEVHAEKSLQISADGKNDKVDANGSSTSERKDSGSTRTGVLANPSVINRDLTTKKPGPTGGDWPHLYDGNNMLVLKEGIINRTKITENGKKLRKNWSSSYAVLTELFLLFFKDAKTFTMMKTGQSSAAKPDISVDLNGALVEHGERASSRKNVYMISTVLGLQVLIQSDNSSVSTEWFQEVHGAIRKLPSGFKSQGKLLSIAAELRINSGNKQNAESNQPEDPKRFSKIARSRSMKMKRLDDSLEDLSGSAAERQTKIKAKLRWFFQRRPAVELLVKNGIYKDEPAFGSYLSDVCPAESPRVPLFVKTCIEVLESKEENMKTDGLYRASGNLSQIQKIRLQVDQYKLDVLAQEEDVHVLAGALKLFFRELKEPLIPSTFFKEAVNASMLKKSSTKIQCFRDIVKALPAPNYDTLQFLLKHLLRVTSYQEFNRMHIPNLAIVFGPTLMWPAEESANMALDFMQQNLVIECLLSEYNKIFK